MCWFFWGCRFKLWVRIWCVCTVVYSDGNYWCTPPNWEGGRLSVVPHRTAQKNHDFWLYEYCITLSRCHFDTRQSNGLFSMRHGGSKWLSAHRPDLGCASIVAVTVTLLRCWALSLGLEMPVILWVGSFCYLSVPFTKLWSYVVYIDYSILISNALDTRGTGIGVCWYPCWAAIDAGSLVFYVHYSLQKVTDPHQ